MLVKLSGRILYIGSGGITRIEPLHEYANERKGGYQTQLSGESNRGVILVKESVEEIETLLKKNVD